MKGKFNFLAGLVLGMFLVTGTGAAAAVVETVTATRTTSPIYVDGEQVEISAYNIGGYNYFRLRDLGELVGFGVEWDQATHSVRIASKSASQTPGADQADGTVRSIPKVGDKIVCTDGYSYEIKDVSKYNNSMFATEPTQALPKPTCDWSLLPQPELPAPEARHFTSGGKEVLFLRNLYETRRMQYTLNNAIGANPETWRNGKPVMKTNGEPMVDIKLYVPNDRNAIPTWPWRSELITEYFNSCPPGTYYLEAWDVFKDGVFQHTEYYLYDE